MSYKSLLFCADEKTARLVTQVLSELDFTVELAVETYATAKKLAEEHFDALVVDCQNEQDASVLFKSARNSTENHSSLSVAVVEGQAGVAKAFRIGANLVLTKPINVEQSKSTLRVARGLLKKNQPKPATGASPETPQPASTFIAPTPKPAPASAFSAAASALSPAFTPVSQTATPASANTPFAGLELDKEQTPAVEAADVAVLESLPQLPKANNPEPAPTTYKADKPFVVSSSAAAAAPAIEKKLPELHPAGSSPLVTNEPIVRAADAPAPFEMHAPVPTFSTLDSRAKDSGGGVTGFLKLMLALALLGVAFYLGWQKLPGLVHRNPAAPKASSSQPAQIEPPVPQSNAAMQVASPAAQPAVAATEQAASNTTAPSDDTGTPASPEQIPAVAAGSSPQPAPSSEDIHVEEMPFSRDTKVTVTPKAQPLIVKNGAARRSTHQNATPTAPSIDIAAADSNSPIADLVTSNAPLPQPALGMIRISQGVSQGLLMKKVAPVYPRMALQIHREGTVELLATIGKDGRIGNVKVVSGDAMLARAAVDAVRQWRYRPYLLNGQPVEIETQVSISFKLPR